MAAAGGPGSNPGGRGDPSVGRGGEDGGTGLRSGAAAAEWRAVAQEATFSRQDRAEETYEPGLDRRPPSPGLASHGDRVLPLDDRAVPRPRMLPTSRETLQGREAGPWGEAGHSWEAMKNNLPTFPRATGAPAAPTYPRCSGQGAGVG